MYSRPQLRRSGALGFVRQEIGATVRHLIVATLLAIVLSVMLVEAVGMALTWAPPSLPTHLAAGAVALALGYAVAVTMLFRALLRGIGRSAEWVTGELEGATERVLHDGIRQHSPGSTVPVTPAVPSTSANPTRPPSTMEQGVMAGIPAK